MQPSHVTGQCQPCIHVAKAGGLVCRKFSYSWLQVLLNNSSNPCTPPQSLYNSKHSPLTIRSCSNHPHKQANTKAAHYFYVIHTLVGMPYDTPTLVHYQHLLEVEVGWKRRESQTVRLQGKAIHHVQGTLSQLQLGSQGVLQVPLQRTRYKAGWNPRWYSQPPVMH